MQTVDFKSKIVYLQDAVLGKEPTTVGIVIIIQLLIHQLKLATSVLCCLLIKVGITLLRKCFFYHLCELLHEAVVLGFSLKRIRRWRGVLKMRVLKVFSRVLQSAESRMLLLIGLQLVLIGGNADVVLKLLLLLRGRVTVLIVLLVPGVVRRIVCHAPSTIMTTLSHYHILVVYLDPTLRIGLRTIHIVMGSFNVLKFGLLVPDRRWMLRLGQDLIGGVGRNSIIAIKGRATFSLVIILIF